MDEVWNLVTVVRTKTSSLQELNELIENGSELESLLKEYKKRKLNTIDEKSLWLAQEMVEAAKDIATAKRRVQYILDH